MRAVGKGKVGPGLLLSFRLGGSAHSLVSSEKFSGSYADIRVASTAPVIEKGRVLFAMYCGRCHGGNVVSGGSCLTCVTPKAHAQMFEEIVRGGGRGSSACLIAEDSRQSKFDSSMHTFSTRS